jgi:ATP-binding cassette, subfamily B, bacterial
MSTLLRVFSRTRSYPLRTLLSLFMAIACTVLVLALPAVTQRFIDEVIGKKRLDLLVPTAAVGIGAIFCRQFLFTLRTYFNNVLEQKLVHDLRLELYSKLQRLPVKWFDSNSSGEIMSRVASDVPAMDRVIVDVLDQSIAAVLQFLIVISYMLYHSWELTLVTLAPLPFIGLLTIWYSRYSEPLWSESSKASSALNSLLHDNLSGIRQIKAYTVEPEALDRFRNASSQVGEKHMKVMRGNSIVWPMVSLLAESGIICLVAAGAWWVLKGKLETGMVMSFVVAWGFLFDPVSRIPSLMQNFLQGLVAAKRVYAILDTPDEDNLTEGKRPTDFHGLIEFKNAGFSYAPDAPAVSGLTLTARPGMTVALVGPTGAGKSTVLNLLTRFYETEQGSICLDGTDIKELSKEWLRDHTGYVTQESFMFNTSLRDNLLLAKKDATDTEIWAALEAANAAGFIREMPEGLDTIAGERGVRFSGGERQRLSIARALLKNPPLLLLDEATSALDNETERLVQEALDNLRADRTSFVIAHRLSTVRQADLICVLEDGKLIESGKHHDLLAQGGLYAKLCAASLRES